jgi:CBS domain-containing protein
MLPPLLIATPAAPLQLSDKVYQALSILEDLKVSSWPVVNESVYMGLITEEVLMDADADHTIDTLKYELRPFKVLNTDHYLNAAGLMSDRQLDVLPVTTPDGEFLGVVMMQAMLLQLTRLVGAASPGALVVLEMDPIDFSPGEISRLIETNDAQIRQLNTQIDEHTGRMIVTIRINKQEVSDIIATFQRYDYRVAYFVGEEQYENELRRNYHHLLHYIEM